MIGKAISSRRHHAAMMQPLIVNTRLDQQLPPVWRPTEFRRHNTTIAKSQIHLLNFNTFRHVDWWLRRALGDILRSLLQIICLFTL